MPACVILKVTHHIGTVTYKKWSVSTRIIARISKENHKTLTGGLKFKQCFIPTCF